jgi:hypothetical protein
MMFIKRLVLLVIIYVAATAQTACQRSGFSDGDLCFEVDCSGHGLCAVDPQGRQAVCICQPGYEVQGLHCLEARLNDPCAAVTCSSHGLCVVLDNDARCLCDPGYQEQIRGECEAAPNLVDGGDCSGHGTSIVTSDCRQICACDTGFHNDGDVACVADL